MESRPLIASILGGLFDARKYVLDNIVYYSFVVYGFVDVPFQSIVKRTYYDVSEKNLYHELNLSQNWDIDPLLKIAESEYEACRKRHDELKEKCKEIRLFCLLIIGLISFLSATVLSNNNPVLWVLVPLAFSLFFLGLSIVILLVFWDKMIWSVVSLDDEMSKHQGGDLKIFLTKKYHECIFHNDLRLNYLVDVVRVARFYFMLAFTALAVALLFGIFLI